MTAIKIHNPDHLRDAVMHAHTDMTVGLMLLRKWRLIMAWRKLHQGYERLGKAPGYQEHNATMTR